METSKSRIGQLTREQLDRRLDEIREVLPFLQTRTGWLKQLRGALGMSQVDLAHRMGVTKQAVSQLEKREREGAVTIAALEHAAKALDCELVYALVPRQPIQKTLEERARRIATEMVGSVRHSMRLEDQEPMSALNDRIRALTDDLLASPEQLWSPRNDE